MFCLLSAYGLIADPATALLFFTSLLVPAGACDMEGGGKGGVRGGADAPLVASDGRHLT